MSHITEKSTRKILAPYESVQERQSQHKFWQKATSLGSCRYLVS